MIRKNYTLLIGPLPPPWGGARVSFKLFYDYVKKYTKANVVHYDLPIRFEREKNPPGKVDHFKTLCLVFLCFVRIPFVSNVIVFGSSNFCFTYGLFLLMLSKILRKPFHLRFFGGHPAQNTLLRFPVIGSIITRLILLADKIIVQTYAGAKEFPEYLQGKISVVVGYRPAHQLAFEDEELSDDIFRFVYTGNISREKGVGHLLDAFKMLQEKIGRGKDIELHLYGAGENELIDKFKSEEKVFYHGRVDNSILLKALSSYDVFVFTTVYSNEGHSGSVVEALMAGLPVIASDLSGVAEIIENKGNGLLVAPGDTKQLAIAMEKLIQSNELRKHLADQALKSSKAFDTDHVLPKLAAAVGIEI